MKKTKWQIRNEQIGLEIMRISNFIIDESFATNVRQKDIAMFYRVLYAIRFEDREKRNPLLDRIILCNIKKCLLNILKDVNVSYDYQLWCLENLKG